MLLTSSGNRFELKAFNIVMVFAYNILIPCVMYNKIITKFGFLFSEVIVIIFLKIHIEAKSNDATTSLLISNISKSFVKVEKWQHSMVKDKCDAHLQSISS